MEILVVVGAIAFWMLARFISSKTGSSFFGTVAVLAIPILMLLFVFTGLTIVLMPMLLIVVPIILFGLFVTKTVYYIAKGNQNRIALDREKLKYHVQ